MIIDNDKDILEIQNKIKSGDVFSFASPDKLKKIIQSTAEHYLDADFFQTVESKTLRMIKEKVIPKYMIDYWKK